MNNIPFLLSLDSPTYYDHNMFPNRMYRRLHERHHDPLDLHTLGMIAHLGAHAHHLAAKKRNGELSALGGGVKDKRSDFEINLDVGLFQPDELSVKLVNGYIVVEGKHDEREDGHGHITRHFIRRYELPKGYDADAIVSTLSSDGVLGVRVPKPIEKSMENERVIQIKQVGPSDLFLNNHNNNDEENKEQK